MSDQKLLRVLGNKDVLALAFGAMIGWGWVVTTDIWILGAGSMGAMLAFMIGGLLVILIGLTYAELTAALPLAGGELFFAYRALGGTASFITAWALILGYISVIAFEAVALPTVFEYIIPDYSKGHMYTLGGWDVTATWVGVGMIGSIIMAWVNYRGVQLTSALMVVLTGLILAAGALLIGGGSFNGSTETMQPFFVDGAGGLMTIIIMTPFMFVGFDVIPQAAEEINLPMKRIGQLLVFSVVLAILWYVGIIFGVSRVMGPSELQESTLVTADAMVNAYGGSALMGNLLVLGGVGGILTSWLGFYVGGSRALYAMARGGMLPAWLADLHPRYKTPHKAILLIAVLTTAAPLLGRPALVWLVDAGGLSLVVAWLMVAASFLVLRKKAPDMRRPFHLSAGVLIGWLAVLMALVVGLLYMPGMPSALVWPYEWGIIGAWALLGLVFYRMSFTSRNRVNINARMQHEIDALADTSEAG